MEGIPIVESRSGLHLPISQGSAPFHREGYTPRFEPMTIRGCNELCETSLMIRRQVERMAEFILIILALLVLDETRNLALIILGIVLFYFLVL